jgi:hypothetical protein
MLTWLIRVPFLCGQEKAVPLSFALLSKAKHKKQPTKTAIKLVVATQFRASGVQWKTLQQFHLVVTE